MTFTTTWDALGAAVVHFLWQGTLIGLLTATALRALRSRSAGLRYTLAGSALLASLACFLVTLALALAAAGPALPSVAVGEGTATPSVALFSGSGATGLAALGWSIGVLVMAVRAALQTLAVRRLARTRVSDPDPIWQRAFVVLRRRLGVDRGVRLLASGIAEVPMVVGWLSPVVLVPAALFTRMSPDQLRALLAHELAHVRRHDHLLNAVQAVVEIVLFFHPAVWWISKQVRAEREYCCDDSSVRLTGNPRLLAEALAALEAIRIARQPQAALAADGGPLMKRIARILGTRPTGSATPSGWQLPAGLALAGLLTLAGGAFAAPLDDDDPRPHRHEIHQDGEHADLDAFRERIEREVAAGKMTRKEGDQALEIHLIRLRHAQALRDIERRLKAGEISKAEAGERLAGLKKRIEFHRVEREIEAALAAGKLTPEEARVKMAAVREKLHTERRFHPDQASEEIRHIEQAVEKGELTPAEGRARIDAVRKAAAERHPADPAAAIARIQAAVEAGEMTPEEGKRQVALVREKAREHGRFRRSSGERADLDTMRKIEEIHAAVQAGELTAAEGARQVAELHERLAKHRLHEKVQKEKDKEKAKAKDKEMELEKRKEKERKEKSKR